MDATDPKPAVISGTTPGDGAPPMPTRRLVLAGFLIMLAGCASAGPNPRASTAPERSAECLRTGGRWFTDSSGSATCLSQSL